MCNPGAENAEKIEIVWLVTLEEKAHEFVMWKMIRLSYDQLISEEIMINKLVI